MGHVPVGEGLTLNRNQPRQAVDSYAGQKPRPARRLRRASKVRKRFTSP